MIRSEIGLVGLWKIKGLNLFLAKSVEEAIIMVKKAPPAFAAIDLRLLDGNGLDVVQEIHKLKPDSENRYVNRLW